MDTGKTVLFPVDSDENLKTLSVFKNFLLTARGPEASCKLVVTGGGVLQVMPSTSSLVKFLDLENPICRYIGCVAAGMIDQGLYFGVLATHLCELQWSENRISKQKLSKIISSLMSNINRLIFSECAYLKVDFSSISSLVSLVRTVVASKINTLCVEMDFDGLTIEIVKLFVNCIDEHTNSCGRINVKVESGPNCHSSYNGILYQITEYSDIKRFIKNYCEVKILIFTQKLDSELDPEMNQIIIQTKSLLEQAIKLNVAIVACQKTVAAEIKLFMQRRNLLLLERMGTDLTRELIHVSGAFPISQLSFDFSDLYNMLGSLSSIQLVQFCDNDYILLQNKKKPSGTLLIQSQSLAGPDFIKTLVEQALSALRSVAAHPALTLGGGCLEVWLVTQTQQLKGSKSDKDLNTLIEWLQSALLSTCTSHCEGQLMVDTVYHHGWSEEQAIECKCRMIQRVELDKLGGFLVTLEQVTSSQTITPPRKPPASFPCYTLTESHSQKTNAIISALEVFASLSDIGLILYKD